MKWFCLLSLACVNVAFGFDLNITNDSAYDLKFQVARSGTLTPDQPVVLEAGKTYLYTDEDDSAPDGVKWFCVSPNRLYGFSSTKGVQTRASILTPPRATPCKKSESRHEKS
jgi:hypothetical protein